MGVEMCMAENFRLGPARNFDAISRPGSARSPATTQSKKVVYEACLVCMLSSG